MDCVHHWVIDPPNGSEIVGGTCRNCGTAKPFYVMAAQVNDYAGPEATSQRIEMNEIIRGAEYAAGYRETHLVGRRVIGRA